MPAPIQFSVSDLEKPDSLERVLRQFQLAIHTLPVPPPFPSLTTLAAQLAPLLAPQFQAGGSSPLNLQSLLPAAATNASLTEDTHANRLALYATPTVLGSLFFETDRTVTYAVVNSLGSLVWRYLGGVFVAAFAARPVDLGVNDSGFLFYATDQDTVYIWTGAAYDTISRRILLGGFFAIFTHANSADRTYTLPNATGSLVYETAALVNNNFLFGGGGALAKDAGFAVVPVANGGTGVTYDKLAAAVVLTNQGAAVTTTAFANSGTAGTYRVSWYLMDTTADVTAGTVQLTILWQDDVGVTSATSVALPLTALGRTSGSVFLQVVGGVGVFYSTAVVGIFGTAKYALYLDLERIS